jgi:hypothetical protein
MPDSTDFKTWTITRYKEIAGWVWWLSAKIPRLHARQKVLETPS